MDVISDFSDIGSFFSEANRELEEFESRCGEQAVRYAVENGEYQDVTGNLRRSNRYEVQTDGVALVNDAEYASHVEARGRDVLSGASLELHRLLNQ